METFTIFGIKITHVIAGVLGGTVRAFLVGGGWAGGDGSPPLGYGAGAGGGGGYQGIIVITYVPSLYKAFNQPMLGM